MSFEIKKPKNNAGLPTTKKGEATLAYAKDVLSFPAVADDGVTLLGNFAFNPNATFGKLYMTPSTQAASYESGGNPDGMGTKNKFVGEHPGNSKEILSFIKKNMNEEFIIIYGGSCSTNAPKKVMGTPCNPMKLSASGEDNKDGNKQVLTFEQEIINDELVFEYEGVIDFGSVPTSAAAVTFDKDTARIVQLEDSAVGTDITVSGTDVEDGQIYTLIGGGGASPFVLNNAPAGTPAVLLKEASDWIGLKDSVINLKVVKAEKTYFVEVSRQ